jgi:hypothetical protein
MTLLDISRRAERLSHSIHCEVAKGLRGEHMQCRLKIAPGLINGFVAAQQGTADWIFVPYDRAREIPAVRA